MSQNTQNTSLQYAPYVWRTAHNSVQVHDVYTPNIQTVPLPAHMVKSYNRCFDNVIFEQMYARTPVTTY